MRREPGVPLICVLGVLLAASFGSLSGCGGGEGVSTGAVASVYVGAPLCREAQRRLAASHGRAGDVRVQAVCLDEAWRGKRLDLAAIGANARRATEDSAAVAYLEPPGRANRFSRPIVEEAGIAWMQAGSGDVAMGRVLRAISEAGSSSLRDGVREALQGQ